MDTIETMRVFVAVAAEESFTGAAKRLGLSVQMTSKYVRQLEERLQVVLFDRTTRTVLLNDTGKAYLERCTDLLQQLDEVEASVRDEHGRPSGRIRITAPTAFGERHLAPALTGFIKAYPEITIDLDLSNRKVALVEEGYDMAIRIDQLIDSSMIARKLTPMRRVVCASKKYIQEYGKPKHPAELAEHLCIIDRNLKNQHQWPFYIDGAVEKISVSGPFESNSPAASRQMALAGVGIAFCPMYIVSPDITEGRLEVLFDDCEAYDFGVYAVYPHRRHLSAKIRTLVDYFVKHFYEF